VACLGKLTAGLFTTLFEEYLFDPSYICSDSNSVYEQYCKAFNVAHYIRPSNYLSVLYNNGYDTPNYSHPTQTKDTEEKNKKI